MVLNMNQFGALDLVLAWSWLLLDLTWPQWSWYSSPCVFLNFFQYWESILFTESNTANISLHWHLKLYLNIKFDQVFPTDVSTVGNFLFLLRLLFNEKSKKEIYTNSSFTHPLIHLLTLSSTHPLTHTFTHPITHSLFYPPTQSRTHSCLHPPTH